MYPAAIMFLQNRKQAYICVYWSQNYEQNKAMQSGCDPLYR